MKTASILAIIILLIIILIQYLRLEHESNCAKMWLHEKQYWQNEYECLKRQVQRQDNR